MTFDPAKFRETMRLWATGVTVVTAKHGDLMRGITVSSFTSVTLEPPLILVCIQKHVETVPVIMDSGAFAVSMLGEGQNHISNLFAGYGDPPLAEGENYFDRVAVQYAATGSPIIGEAMGWVDCKVHQTYDGSTHHIFIGEVMAASGQPESGSLEPLLYHNRKYREFAPHDE